MADPTVNQQTLDTLERFFPGYSQFDVEDLSSIDSDYLGTTLSGFILHPEDSHILVPQPFNDRYGENAVAEYVGAIMAETVRRGEPQIYAQTILAIHFTRASDDAGLNVRESDIYLFEGTNIPAVARFDDGTEIPTTAPSLFNFSIAHAAAAEGSPVERLDTRIENTAVDAIVDHNGLPPELKERNHVLGLSDNMLYAAGYAASAGLSREINPLTMDYSPAAAACQIAPLTRQIFSADGAPISPNIAWATGYIQQDMDTLSPADLSTLMAPCTQTVAPNNARTINN